MRFNFLIIGGPAEDYIERCLESVLDQRYEHWRAAVVLDPVNDRTFEKALKYASNAMRVQLNESRMFALPNLMECVKILNPDPEDILITLDADDWLYTPYALDILTDYYRNPSILMTHGSWASYPNSDVNTNNAPYTRDDFARGIRRVPFRASHLRTFKTKLWDAIDKEDFKDHDGRYFQTAWDIAFQFPMLEMAGFDRVRYIPHTLLRYNQETPYNDGKLYLQQQMYYTDYIAAKPSYSYRETF